MKKITIQEMFFSGVFFLHSSKFSFPRWQQQRQSCKQTHSSVPFFGSLGYFFLSIQAHSIKTGFFERKRESMSEILSLPRRGSKNFRFKNFGSLVKDNEERERSRRMNRNVALFLQKMFN